MVRAKIIEKYIKSTKDGKRGLVQEIVHETRYFSSKELFHQWYNSFKEELWEDDPSKVDMVEGIYVKLEEIELDNLAKPKRLKLYATFRPGISYRYAS